jgi:hypothetical protein
MRSVATCLVLATQSIVATFVGSAIAQAHDWYPAECCSGQDCMTATKIEVDRNGWLLVLVGELRVPIPPGFAIRTSPDSHIHICFRESFGDVGLHSHLVPMCLFLPTQS